jgi:hypothetical protein
MKQAKMMLTAIVVLAVVGGALAFKAKTFGSSIYTSDVNGVCDVFYDNHTITDDTSAPQFISASPVALTTTCPQTFVIPQQ